MDWNRFVTYCLFVIPATMLFFLGYTIFDARPEIALDYFVIGAIVLAFPRISDLSLKWGGNELSLKTTKATADLENMKPLVADLSKRLLDLESPQPTLVESANATPTTELNTRATDSGHLSGSAIQAAMVSRVVARHTLAKSLEEKAVGPYPTDPWARFAANRSGPPESTGSRRLIATVLPARGKPGLFEVDLTLIAEDGTQINGPVGFLLHPTFPEPRRVVNPENGRAHLRLIAWGAFTVGCVDDHGDHLEINLAKLPDAPPLFRSR